MEALAEHDFVLQQEIPVVEQMDAQLAERNPALQAPLARKKCALNAHFISKAHRNVSCNGMSTNCLRHFTVHRQSLAGIARMQKACTKMHALLQNPISLIKMSHTKNEHELLATPLHSLSLLPKPEHIP